MAGQRMSGRAIGPGRLRRKTLERPLPPFECWWDRRPSLRARRFCRFGRVRNHCSSPVFPVSRFFGSCGIRPSNADVRLSRWAGSSPKKDAGGTATPFRVLVGPPPPFGRGVLAVFSGRKAICKDSYDFPPRFLDVRHPILFTVRVSRVAGGKAESSPGKFSLRFCTERGEV